MGIGRPGRGGGYTDTCTVAINSNVRTTELLGKYRTLLGVRGSKKWLEDRNIVEAEKQ